MVLQPQIWGGMDRSSDLHWIEWRTVLCRGQARIKAQMVAANAELRS